MKSRIGFVCLLVSLTFSCASASRIGVEIMKAPTDKVIEKQSVLVMNPQWTDQSGSDLKDIAAMMWAPQKWTKMLEINLTSVLKKSLIENLSNLGLYSLKDADKIKEDLKEKDIDGAIQSMRGSVVAVYKVLSLDTHMEDQSYRTTNNKDVTQFQASISVKIRIELYDGDTGSMVLMKEKSYKDSLVSKFYDTAFDSFKTMEGSISKLVATEVAQAIGPYTVTENRILLPDESNDVRMVNGRSLSRQLKLDEAYQLYSEVYAETGAFVAGFNAALVRAASGKVVDAYGMFKKLYSKTMDERAKAEMDWLRQDVRVSAEYKE